MQISNRGTYIAGIIGTVSYNIHNASARIHNINYAFYDGILYTYYNTDFKFQRILYLTLMTNNLISFSLIKPIYIQVQS